MNAKITFVELVDLMAKATSTTKRVCELFLKDLFAVISQTLIDGESVTVKGVGTFKITSVKPRKSVNVKTGSPMQISGYNKVTFTPDKSLAEAVNQPFAQFETVILDDAVTDEKLAEIDKQHPSSILPDAQEPESKVAEKEPQKTEPIPAIDEPVEEVPVTEDTFFSESDIPVAPLPDELPQMQDAAPAPTPDVLFDSQLPDGDKEISHEVKTPVKEPVVKEEKPQPKVEETVPVRKPMLVGRPIDGPSQPIPEQEKPEEVDNDRHFYRPEPRNVYTPTPEQIEEAQRKPDRRWLWLLLSGLAILLMFWLMARGCSDSNPDVPEQEVVAADTIADDELTEEEQKAADAKQEKKDDVKSEKKEEVKPEKKEEVKPEKKEEVKPEKKAETKSEKKAEEKPASKVNNKEVTDVVTSQIVLTTLSEKHYGSPWFWVYIYEENVARGTINDPNNIRPGTRVVIPPASKYGINPNDKASLRKAQIKSMEYLKGK